MSARGMRILRPILFSLSLSLLLPIFSNPILAAPAEVVQKRNFLLMKAAEAECTRVLKEVGITSERGSEPGVFTWIRKKVQTAYELIFGDESSSAMGVTEILSDQAHTDDDTIVIYIETRDIRTFRERIGLNQFLVNSLVRHLKMAVV